MALAVWLTYLGVIAALILFPGPSALLCMSHGLRYGRRRALATVVGGALAALVLMTLSSLGLGAILATSETAFIVLKAVGAAYLIYLGVQAWRTPAEPMATPAATRKVMAGIHATRRLFIKGLTIGLSNPKDLLFFAALFPNFIDPGQPQWSQFVILALTWLVVDLAAMTTYVCVGSTVSRWFGTRRRVKLFNRASGSLFVAAGGALASSHR
ncbi:Threonine/homoserine/homoserine lactone efflux protein [Kushneria avicenniae]|uniref:Threonine/homoserine/homoserine lactone efflux protein n=1 Tax=Kushneria avicenniae TaxID=402385 RepID=A0A1I1N8S2_9GAMM|nr:LysE family transporter [Kushneria avicenniae]SFC91868.1 Threonine/homoserine/homoserine lactone efflux protein [Kushneria avicenniae]